MELKDKRILLTGASGGIGQAIARRLDQQGAKLWLVGRNLHKLQLLLDDLVGDHTIIITDLNDEKGREKVISSCEQQGLDLYINAVGVMDFQFYEQQDSRVIEKMLSTNLVSPMLLCQRLIPILQSQPEAAIVNIGSTFGSIGHPGFTAYCASKFGLRGFTEALQRELADTRIKVSYLAPRATQTELNSDAVRSLNKALGNHTDTPDQVARELMVILSSNQQQRYMGWPEKFFVRLNGLFPGIVHSALVKKLSIVRQYAEKSSHEG
jgi:short-subunit dehydrogenase